MALSGGLDSVVLLHALISQPRPWHFLLGVLHVNHGINPRADQWQDFCERLCTDWGIPFAASRVRVAQEGHESLEAAARRARHEVFRNEPADWLVLAHHRDDQAETVLLNLLRGAGPSGAAAMPAVRRMQGTAGPSLLRPFLEVTRAELAEFARTARLAWVEDDSNQDLRHTRNFVRQRVLPLLRERFAGCDDALARAAVNFGESDALLAELARIDAASVVRGGRLVVAGMLQLDELRAGNLLRHFLREQGILMPDRARLREILRQIREAAPPRTLRFDLGTRTLHRYRGEVWLVASAVAGGEREWFGERAVDWGGGRIEFTHGTGEGIARDQLDGAALRIAPRRGGERFRPDGGRPRRDLRKLLQERAVPPWMRDTLPLLWHADELVWVPGIGVDSAWQCAAGEPGITPAWFPASG